MNKRLFSVLYMFLLTLLFTSLVSAVRVLSHERIEANQKAKLQGIVLQVLGMADEAGATREHLSRVFEARVKSLDVQGRALYVAYEEGGQDVRGYALPVGGPGFWGPIHGMVGVDADAQKITGIAFYQHSETPGLGARMTEEWFTRQFAGLTIYPITGDRQIFYLKPAGGRRAANELDAITGATGTSRAVEAFLNRELDRFLTTTWEKVDKG